MNSRFIVNESTEFFIMPDPYNEARNVELYNDVRRYLKITDDPTRADAYLCIGGDGTLFKAVRDPVRKKLNLPILPLNGGTVGKNLIDIESGKFTEFAAKLLHNQCNLVEFPMIEIEATNTEGETRTFYAFNDIWVDRLMSQSVRYDVFIEDKERFDGHIKLSEDYISGDGILFCTPVGSTGYARMLGEMVLPLHSNTILVAPMASMTDKRKVHAFAINRNQSLRVDFHDADFRPARLAVEGVYIDYEETGKHFFAQSIRIKISSPEHNIKLVTDDPIKFMQKQIDFIAR